MPDHETPAMTALVRHPDGRVEQLGAERLDQIDKLCAIDGTLVWVSAVSPGARTIEVMRREFDLHPLVVEDLDVGVGGERRHHLLPTPGLVLSIAARAVHPGPA